MEVNVGLEYQRELYTQKVLKTSVVTQVPSCSDLLLPWRGLLRPAMLYLTSADSPAYLPGSVPPGSSSSTWVPLVECSSPCGCSRWSQLGWGESSGSAICGKQNGTSIENLHHHIIEWWRPCCRWSRHRCEPQKIWRISKNHSLPFIWFPSAMASCWCSSYT